jgi:2-polyprenyl-3-methyl-5-hydroxy-6-metoxy-1,4-benzoquinol methylase
MNESEKTHRVIEDPEYGYHRLDPLPSDSALSEFYESRYYDLIRKGGRAPELRRHLEGGEEGRRELEWLRATLYDDIAAIFERHADGKRILDVGCGTGELVGYLAERGFAAEGLEPSIDAAAEARARGRTVTSSRLEPFAERGDAVGVYDGVTFVNVMEHVPHPVAILRATRRLLAPRGIVAIRVPNDFNDLQRSAQSQLNLPPYWIAVPDHVNYFSVRSLAALLERVGFDVLYTQTDFPMEMFLLMGENYISDTSLGRVCHKKRVTFELGIPSPIRRRLYAALASVDLGRNTLVFARKTADFRDSGGP